MLKSIIGLFIFLMINISFAHAMAIDCSLIVKTNEALLLYNSSWEQIAEIDTAGSDFYNTSPNGRYVALEKEENYTTWVDFYEVTSNGFQFLSRASQTRFLDGNFWSPNHEQVLLQGEYSQGLSKLFNIQSGELRVLTELVPLRLTEVLWVDDSTLLFIAENNNSPDPRGLYQLDTINMTYTRLTDPMASSGWYNEITEQGHIAFNQCYNRTECELKIIMPDETESFTLVGNYRLIANLPHSGLLILLLDEEAYALGIFNLDTLAFDTIIPVEMANYRFKGQVSPDEQYIAVENDDTFMIVPLQNSDVALITLETIFDRWVWNLDNNSLLITNENSFYELNLVTEEHVFLFSVPEGENIQRFSWVCINTD